MYIFLTCKRRELYPRTIPAAQFRRGNVSRMTSSYEKGGGTFPGGWGQSGRGGRTEGNEVGVVT